MENAKKAKKLVVTYKGESVKFELDGIELPQCKVEVFFDNHFEPFSKGRIPELISETVRDVKITIHANEIETRTENE